MAPVPDAPDDAPSGTGGGAGTSARAELDMVRAALAADYEIVREIGRGGMAIVYLARERALDRDVAIKVLPQRFSFDEGFTERFEREARVSGSLEHPHIVPIYRVGRSAHVTWFVMQYLRGRSLADVLLERGALPVDEVRRILLETAGALGYAARRGVVHRDVKPDNIMLDEDGRCIVTDFGIARSASEARLTATGMTVGTPKYMSPEQARSRPLDGRSDLYSLGIVAYECLVGATPFDGEDAFGILLAHIKSPLPRPVLRTPEERELWAVIERLLAKEPGDRWQSADEVVTALGGRGPVTGQGVAYARRAALSPTRPAMPVPSSVVTRPGDRAQVVVLHARQAVERARARVAAVGRRTWLALGATIALGTGTYYAQHFAFAHRSRCPVPVASGDSASAAAKARALTLLVDTPPGARAGGSVEVYYDVCGMEAGAPYTTRVTVTRNQSGLRRLLDGATAPVRETFDETADGPAVRRHRTLSLDGMPAGSYTMTVSLSDARERRRVREVAFRVR